MDTDCAEGVREEVAFAEEAGCGGFGEVVEVDCCCGEEIFGFGEGVC